MNCIQIYSNIWCNREDVVDVLITAHVAYVVTYVALCFIVYMTWKDKRLTNKQLIWTLALPLIALILVNFYINQ